VTNKTEPPGTIDGAKNPELIPDAVAWKMLFPAVAEPITAMDSELVQIRARNPFPGAASTGYSRLVELAKQRRRLVVDTINDLIELLTFRFPFPKEDDPVGLQPRIPASRYPATTALTEIGRPALPELAKVIETNDPGSLLSKNARFTVRSIFAYRSADGDKFFREAAEKAPTPEAKQRLLKALETADDDWKSD
jgi:hypothetical protein